MKRFAIIGGVALGCLPGAIVVLSSSHGKPDRPGANRSAPRSTGPVLLAIRPTPGHGAPLAPDPEAAQSYPQSATSPPHAVASTPLQAARTAAIAPGAPTDAEVRQELRQMRSAVQAEQAATGGTAGARAASVARQGNARPPRGAPRPVAQVMTAGNAIATFPYRFGGGHGSFVDDAYDCSGSVSYALAAAGLVPRPMTSGDLMQWGVPGPGRWISVYANAGHTYMYVAGLRFDTSGRSGPLGTRWQDAARSNSGFAVRHWPGL